MHSYQRITSVSRILSIVCLVFLVSLPFYLAHHWLLPAHLWLDSMPFGSQIQYFDSWPPTIDKQILGILISFIPGFFIVKGLWHLKQLFALYSQGVFFSETIVSLYNKCSSAALWFVIVWIASQSLMSVAMSYDSVTPVLTVSFTHAHALALFSATLLRVIAMVMSVSHELAQENKSFI